MNYLEMCQKVAQRSGIAGGLSGYPTTVVSQSGRYQLIVDYVHEACRDIESFWNDWTFMRREIDFEITANTPSFDPNDHQADVERVNMVSMTARDGEDRITVTPRPWALERINRVHNYDITSNLPSYVSVDHGGVLHFNPACDHDFILRAEVTLAPTELAADSDTPFIPAAYHWTVVHRALMYNYEDEEAEYLRQAAELRYQDWLLRMEERFLPGNNFRQTQRAEVPLDIVTI